MIEHVGQSKTYTAENEQHIVKEGKIRLYTVKKVGQLGRDQVHHIWYRLPHIWPQIRAIPQFLMQDNSKPLQLITRSLLNFLWGNFSFFISAAFSVGFDSNLSSRKLNRRVSIPTKQREERVRDRSGRWTRVDTSAVFANGRAIGCVFFPILLRKNFF